MILDLGTSSGYPVSYDTHMAANQSALISGVSGAGKTVHGQRLITQIVKSGGTVLAFDAHQTLAEDQILGAYKADFSKFAYEIGGYENGIKLPLLTPVSFEDGTREKKIDTINSLIGVLSQVYKLGCRQVASLRTAIELVDENELYQTEGISAIGSMLKLEKSASASSVREKMYSLICHNIFSDGPMPLKKNRINVLRLSRFELETQSVLIEIILSFIWRLSAANYFRESELFIFVDECQNLHSGSNSILAKLLSEGRKFGINLILATQLLSGASTNDVKRLMLQCGLKQFFQPSAQEIKMVANLIDPVNSEKWRGVLSMLDKGEFVACGKLLVNGNATERAIRVNAFIDEGRDDS